MRYILFFGNAFFVKEAVSVNAKVGKLLMLTNVGTDTGAQDLMG
jgi:hypothetical protein